jgi:hypothetical protein
MNCKYKNFYYWILFFFNCCWGDETNGAATQKINSTAETTNHNQSKNQENQSN